MKAIIMPHERCLSKWQWKVQTPASSSQRMSKLHPQKIKQLCHQALKDQGVQWTHIHTVSTSLIQSKNCILNAFRFWSLMCSVYSVLSTYSTYLKSALEWLTNHSYYHFWDIVLNLEVCDSNTPFFLHVTGLWLGLLNVQGLSFSNMGDK